MFARLRLAQRLDAKPEVAALAAGIQFTQGAEELHRLVVAPGLFRRDESVELSPQFGLATDEAVEVLVSGDCCLVLASCLLLGALIGFDALSLGRVGLGCLEKLPTVLRLVAEPLPPAERCLRCRSSNSATWA